MSDPYAAVPPSESGRSSRGMKFAALFIVAGVMVTTALGFAVVKIGGSVLADVDWEDGAGTGEVPYGDNTLIVGEDLGAGIYRSAEQVGSNDDGIACTWSSFEADDQRRVVAGASIAGGYAVVRLDEGQGLESSGCPEWAGTSSEELFFDPDSAASTISEGMWVVGKDIQPGTYRMVNPLESATGGLCNYSVSDTLRTIAGGYVTNGRAEPGETLTAEAPLGMVFLNQGCGEWERIGD